MKIAYIGIDALISVLDSLLGAGCEITEIFTCDTDNKTEFNTEITSAAKRLHVPLHTDPISAEDINRLKNAGCDAVICAGYYHKVPATDSLPMVNIHPALLPKGRGPWPMPVAILDGARRGGVTLHKMTERFDEGDIILQEEFELAANENLQTYMDKANCAAARLVKRLMENFDRLYASATPQGQGEYWPCPTEQDWTITPQMPREKVDRILRAFYGYECLLKTEGRTLELIGGYVSAERVAGKNCFELRDGGYIIADSATEVD